MAKAKILTAPTVENATAGDTRKEIPDGLVPGMALVVQPSGKKSWAVRYRSPTERVLRDGKLEPKLKKLTLGSYPVLSLADARKCAKEALQAVAEGQDPAAEKQAAKDTARDAEAADRDSFPTAAVHFVDRYAKRNNRVRSWLETARLLGLKPDPESDNEMAKRPLVPTGKGPVTLWKAKRVQDIARRDIIEILDKRVDEGAEISANRLFAALRRMFGWLVERGVISETPCRGIKAPTVERKRDRLLSDDEVRTLWKACDAVGHPFGPMVRVLLLTGARRNEVAGMEWRELDLEGAVWHLPAARAKNGEAHDIALAPAVVELLKAMPKIGKAPGYVFTTTGKTAVSGFSRAKERLDTAMLEAMQTDDPEAEAPADWTLHDLRRVVASGMARLGINLPVIEKCLAHKSGSFAGIMAVYQRHSFAEQQAAAWRAWADFLLALVEGRPADNVVSLHAAGA
ncbi:MAG: site-specific integrase [Rhodospirillaceae bacterium]|nr:site-specific integrase [Rhodospirillaceae bacterium]